MKRIPGGKKGKTMDMTQGAIGRILITFTVPILIGNLFQLLYNTADSVVVGNFVGTSALAAVGATTRICNMMVKFFNGVSIGAGAVISQYFGAKDREHFHQAIQATVFLTIVCCVLFTVIGLLSSDWILREISTPDDFFDEASLYLRIYFAGISGLLIYNIGSAILRAVGNTVYPLIFLLVCNGLNVLLDLVFVVCFRWQIAGVAVATILSQMISAVLVLIVMTRTKEDYWIDWRGLRFDARLTRQIFQIGLPVGFQQAVISFSNVLVQAYINVYGSACVAGWSCYSKVDQYMLLPIQSIGQAMTTFVGQNLGNGKVGRAREGTRKALAATLGIACVMAACIWGSASLLIGLFTSDEQVILYGAKFIRLCSPFAVLCSFTQIFSGALRGAGFSRVPMFVTLVTHVILRQVYLFIISRLLPGNVLVIAIAYPLGWMLCSSTLSVYYRFSRWDQPKR